MKSQILKILLFAFNVKSSNQSSRCFYPLSNDFHYLTKLRWKCQGPLCNIQSYYWKFLNNSFKEEKIQKFIYETRRELIHQHRKSPCLHGLLRVDKYDVPLKRIKNSTAVSVSTLIIHVLTLWLTKLPQFANLNSPQNLACLNALSVSNICFPQHFVSFTTFLDIV
jgi:hypothetical protein